MKQTVRGAEARSLQLRFRRPEPARRETRRMAKPDVSFSLQLQHSFAAECAAGPRPGTPRLTWRPRFGGASLVSRAGAGGPARSTARTPRPWSVGHDPRRYAAGPGERWRVPQATYLAWLDCRALDLGDEPADCFLRRGRVALSRGLNYGAPGAGHVRLNFATAPSTSTRRSPGWSRPFRDSRPPLAGAGG